MNDRIAAFVLGSMTQAERKRVIDARQRDGELDRLIDQAESRLAPLALAGTGQGASAPPHLWLRIERAVREKGLVRDAVLSEPVSP